MSIEVRVSGLVQGVGFRPFVYRLATELGLSGWVRNQTDGVHIAAAGPKPALVAFVERLRTEAPPAAQVDEILVTNPSPAEANGDFVIITSGDDSDEVTRVSPDLPVCDDCLRDMGLRPHSETEPPDAAARRHSYPFTNCTNCGPRFSIVRGLPYDRARTTMASFRMCPDCASEYEDVTNRRFHAQPVACPVCGPRYEIRAAGGATAAGAHPAEPSHIVATISTAIESGGIVAMKGVGGFHLVCDAGNEDAVRELRRRKRREAKPFAIMVADADAAARLAHLSGEERDLLESPARPIVLLRARGEGGAGRILAPGVSNGLGSVGVVLPYMPMHHLLFARLSIPAIVLTSGNMSDEPIAISNKQAQENLGSVADLLVVHDREIHNRQDDSVAMVVAGEPRVLRRSRGYVPNPIRMACCADGIVAFGPEQKSTLCFGRGHEAILSGHIGDVDNPATLAFLEEILDRFPTLFRITPRLVAVDRHPDYLATGVARSLDLPVVPVGHHHAHIASCMVENGLEGEVIGVALDGTGYGDDGAVWGGEFLVGGLESVDRFAHFAYVPLPGGDLAVSRPWRSALSYLRVAYGEGGPPRPVREKLAVCDDTVVTPAEREAAETSIRTGLNAPLSSSAGRLFDAAAAICGLCTHATFDAEGPVRFTDALTGGWTTAGLGNESYGFDISRRDVGDAAPSEGPLRLEFGRTIRQLADDAAAGSRTSLMSLRFHNTIVEAVVAVARRARDERGLDRVVLSGGVFQNWYLLDRSLEKLGEAGFRVYAHRRVPCNDGGISLGQLAVAAARTG